MDVAGGTVTLTNGANLQINSSVANTAQDSSQINITGGTLTAGSPTAGLVQINDASGATGNYASISVSGGSAEFTTTGAGGINLNQTSLANNVSTFSLANGGGFNTSYIENTGNAASTGVLSFNGGTLTATTANGSGLIQNGVTTYVFNGGNNTINNGGFNVSIPVALLAPTGNGVTNIALGGTLTGYIGAPVVKISGGGGKGAAANATFNPATGTITGITITSPGSGYTSAPTVTLIGGSDPPRRWRGGGQCDGHICNWRGSRRRDDFLRHRHDRRQHIHWRHHGKQRHAGADQFRLNRQFIGHQHFLRRAVGCERNGGRIIDAC
jgi:hypothetical protein